MAFPILWVGPSGSGKITAARKYFGCEVGTKGRLRTLEIGDYLARFWEYSTHLEIDVMDLSMMDKKILPEMLQQLLGIQDVLTGKKRMIIRKIHSLSPAASIHLRVSLEEFVWNGKHASAIVQCTAQTVNHSVDSILDGCIYKRMTGLTGLTGLTGVPLSLPPPQQYVEQMMNHMVGATRCIGSALWLRDRTYDLLGLMVTGGDLIGWLSFAIVRLASEHKITTPVAKTALTGIAAIRWIPSYRTPLMIEYILFTVFNALV